MRKTEIQVLNIENFDKCDDLVKTEELIASQIEEGKNKEHSDYSYFGQYLYVKFPIAWTINKFGNFKCQQIIDSVCKEKYDKKLFFVCQHIQVKNLNFHGNIVFSPHATCLDKYTPVPHHAATVNENYSLPFSERKNLMSFVGCFDTHDTRKQLREILEGKKHCQITDTKKWHFYKNQQEKDKNSEFYTKDLGNTKVALCPRGTGPSTIRFWESMAMGCVPLLISDTVKLPLSRTLVDWRDGCIFVPENDIKNIMDYIPTDEKLEKMSTYISEKYDYYFANDKLATSVSLGLLGV
jgi:hypothetical protein